MVKVFNMIKIIYEDRDVIVVEKPVGMESQSSRKFEPDMVSEIKKYLSTNISTKPQSLSTKSRELYVGVIHRLDKPVGGVMVYAKNKKAAAALSKQAADGTMKKIYKAVVCGKLVDTVGNYVDYLLKDGKNNCSQVVDKGRAGCKKAELNYRVLSVLEKAEPLSLVEVELVTGRHHQIRVQFAAHETPLWGDNKYNPRWNGDLPDRRSGSLALAAVSLSFYHPVTGKWMEFTTEPQNEIFSRFQ